MAAPLDYLAVNAANWDARADVHVGPDGYDLARIADPQWISQVVQFDRPRLGEVAGLDAVHLQCHLGTDTISLARLGASMTGVDLSGRSLQHARTIAERAGVQVDYVQADVYSAVEALAGRDFDLVYTGVGALCWLPDIGRWAQVVARLLRSGGRLFVRDGHPVLNTLVGVTVRDHHPDRDQQSWISGPGQATPALELPYWENEHGLLWSEEQTYAGSGTVTSPVSQEWNHALSEIVMAVLDAGLRLELLVEHDSVPWEAQPGLMVVDEAGEWRLKDRPERLPASFTLVARKP
ncbi:class I SAM-dependent methyltransferase [Tessaracoccus sp. SD287]|uniref:class I SAM-dependent methyltransferase n=1 Tax=Tessaracoccus sp. SD287 TaxID=2782008 RepID=UPI001DDD59E1|nr:class I SAM-dependent methyltransferase [Tessaracoccus sp. SD287]MBO1030726.1 class I SAM-dependent methyltransferase [Tessaracoccus sp. SD287]